MPAPPKENLFPIPMAVFFYIAYRTLMWICVSVLVDIYNFLSTPEGRAINIVMKGWQKPDFLDDTTELPPEDHFKNIYTSTADSCTLLNF